MKFNHIDVLEKESGAITEITLKNPPGNVLTMALLGEISEQIKIDENKPYKKLIVIGAQGKHFSFGASVQEHTAEKIMEMLPLFHKVLGDIIHCSIPTLAKVSGMCLGGGFELALSCTFICADESAQFGLPEISLGVFPPAACALLPLRAGDALSATMILTGDQVEPKALQAAGLLSLLVPEGNLDAEVIGFFEKKFKLKSASSLRIAHKASRLYASDMYDKFVTLAEKLYLTDLASTPDAQEGISSFLEKRPPKWQ